MEKKTAFAGSNFKKQSQMEPVYRLDKDLNTVLHQIVSDLKEKENSELRKKVQIPWRDANWCNIKISGDDMEINCTKFEGDFTVPRQQNTVLVEKQLEVEKCLEKFEKCLKSEFKERTGRALSFGKPKMQSAFELIALNGLYRFWAKKVGKIKNQLPGQSWDEDSE